MPIGYYGTSGTSGTSVTPVQAQTPQQLVQTANDVYASEQTRKANKLFAKHIDPAGNLNESGYYKDASEAGLAPEHIKRAIDRALLQKQAQLDLATKQNALMKMGYDPTAAGRNTAQIGEPKSEIQYIPTNQPAPAETKQPLTHENLWNYLKEKFVGGKGQPPAPVVPTQAGPGAPATQLDEFLGFQAKQAPTEATDVRVPGSILQGPDMSYAQSANVPVEVKQPDLRSAEQKVLDSFDVSKTAGGAPTDKKYFTIDNTTTPETTSTIITSLQRDGALGDISNLPQNERIVAINNALKNSQEADYASIGPAPQLLPDANGNTDLNAYAQKERDYQAKLATVYPQWIAKYGKAYADQLGLAMNKDANARAEYANSLVKEGRAATTELGLNPNLTTPSEAADLKGRKNLLDNTGEMLLTNRDDFLGKNGVYKQRNMVAAFLNNMSNIEGIDTEAGREGMKSLMEFNPSWLKGFQEEGLAGLKKGIIQSMIHDPVSGIDAMNHMLDEIKSKGILIAQLKAKGWKGDSEKPAPIKAPVEKKKLTNEDLKKELTKKKSKISKPKSDPMGIF